MKAARALLSLSHERPWLLINAKSGKWAPAAWTPFWKAGAQSVNYIPENFIAPNADGSWLRTLWQVSRTVDAKGLAGLGADGQRFGDWVKVPLDGLK